MMMLNNALAFLAAFAGFSAQLLPDCAWTVARDTYSYTFDLSAPQPGFPQGLLNADGYYKVEQKNRAGEVESTLWFQPCMRMAFQTQPPRCTRCPLSCGGDAKCGSLCSSILSTNVEGTAYPQCSTMAQPGRPSFSLLDEAKPTAGLAITLPAGDRTVGGAGNATNTLTLLISCAPSPSDVKYPKFNTTQLAGGAKSLVLSMSHPSACPFQVSTASSGWGWLLILLIIVVVVVFVLYFIVKYVYNLLYLEKEGYEAVPFIEFFRSVPHHMKQIPDHVQKLPEYTRQLPEYTKNVATQTVNYSQHVTTKVGEYAKELPNQMKQLPGHITQVPNRLREMGPAVAGQAMALPHQLKSTYDGAQTATVDFADRAKKFYTKQMSFRQAGPSASATGYTPIAPSQP